VTAHAEYSDCPEVVEIVEDLAGSTWPLARAGGTLGLRRGRPSLLRAESAQARRTGCRTRGCSSTSGSPGGGQQCASDGIRLRLSEGGRTGHRDETECRQQTSEYDFSWVMASLTFGRFPSASWRECPRSRLRPGSRPGPSRRSPTCTRSLATALYSDKESSISRVAILAASRDPVKPHP